MFILKQRNTEVTQLRAIPALLRIGKRRQRGILVLFLFFVFFTFMLLAMSELMGGFQPMFAAHMIHEGCLCSTKVRLGAVGNIGADQGSSGFTVFICTAMVQEYFMLIY